MTTGRFADRAMIRLSFGRQSDYHAGKRSILMGSSQMVSSLGIAWKT
jgi:hypothetical protein